MCMVIEFPPENISPEIALGALYTLQILRQLKYHLCLSTMGNIARGDDLKANVALRLVHALTSSQPCPCVVFPSAPAVVL